MTWGARRRASIALIVALMSANSFVPMQCVAAEVATSDSYYGRWIEAVTKKVADRKVEDAGILLDLASLSGRLTDVMEIRRLREDPAAARIIRFVIPLTRSSSYEYRVGSTVILVNVVDNTTVCLVLNELSSGKLPDVTRYNLLQVVRAVSGYMYSDNVALTESTLKQMGAPSTDSEIGSRTKVVIEDIRRGMRSSSNATVPLQSEPELYARRAANCPLSP